MWHSAPRFAYGRLGGNNERYCGLAQGARDYSSALRGLNRPRVLRCPCQAQIDVGPCDCPTSLGECRFANPSNPT